MNDNQLLEAFDKPLEFQRTLEGLPVYVLDEYTFTMNGMLHAVRFINGKVYGKRASIVVFGKKVGKSVVKKIDDITNIRQYFATILAIFEAARENPTDKLKIKMDGFILYIPDELWEKGKSPFIRIFKAKFMTAYDHSQVFHGTIDEGITGFYFWKRGRTFKSVFDKADDLFKDEVADVVAAPVEVQADTMKFTATEVEPLSYKVKASKPADPLFWEIYQDQSQIAFGNTLEEFIGKMKEPMQDDE